MNTTQTTLTLTDGMNALPALLASKTITQRDFWLLTGDYRVCLDYPLTQNSKDGERKE